MPTPVFSFDVCTIADPDPIDIFKFYDEIEGTTLFLFPTLKLNVKVFISSLFMGFVLNFRMTFLFYLISTFKFSIFIVIKILTFLRYCYYFMH